jgi:anti-sigma regulatory factor (Ser/Thr protein kinase)
MVVICTRCGDAVDAELRCPTCGTPYPQKPATDRAPQLDEALLDQVGVALAAQASLARRTARARVATAAELYRDAVMLRSRLTRQADLLRKRSAALAELRSQTEAVLDQVQAALAETPTPGRADGLRSLTARLPRDPTCAVVARRLIEGFAREGLSAQTGGDATLIASELATNAFLHGEGMIVLLVRRRQHCLRIEVRDDGHPDRIEMIPEPRRTTSGRGLWMVDQLATRWGVRSGTGHVWAELAL